MVLYNRTEGERATEGDEPARSQAPQVHKIFYEGAIIMLMPTIFTRDLFDDMFDPRFYGYQNNDLMRTDVKETENGYEVAVDMPGVKKEDVKAELKDGYLTISATVNQDNDEKDKDGKYIRRERYSGSFSRSFYVGEDMTQDDIRAKFEDGTLMLTVPKKEARPQVDEKKYIAIEG